MFDKNVDINLQNLLQVNSLLPLLIILPHLCVLIAPSPYTTPSSILLSNLILLPLLGVLRAPSPYTTPYSRCTECPLSSLYYSLLNTAPFSRCTFLILLPPRCKQSPLSLYSSLLYVYLVPPFLILLPPLVPTLLTLLPPLDVLSAPCLTTRRTTLPRTRWRPSSTSRTSTTWFNTNLTSQTSTTWFNPLKPKFNCLIYC